MWLIPLIVTAIVIVLAFMAVTRYLFSRPDVEKMDWGYDKDEGRLDLVFEDDTIEDVEARFETLSFEDERPRDDVARTSRSAADVSWYW